MAYSWFRVDSSVVDHPKTGDLEVALGDPNAGWYVIRLWSWVQRYAPDGLISYSRSLQIEPACRWRGGVGKLLKSLIDIGWLDDLGNGLFEVHDWPEFQKSLHEKSRKDAQSKRNTRNAKKATGARRNSAEDAPGARAALLRTDETDGRNEQDEPPPPEPPPPTEPVDEKPVVAVGEEFRVWFNDLRRARRGLEPEPRAKNFAEKWADFGQRPVAAQRRAAAKYIAHQDFAGADWSINVFLSPNVYGSRLKIVDVEPIEPCVCCGAESNCAAYEDLRWCFKCFGLAMGVAQAHPGEFPEKCRAVATWLEQRRAA